MLQQVAAFGPRHIWIFYRQEEEDGQDYMHMSYVIALERRPVLVYNESNDSIARAYIRKIFDTAKIQQEPTFWHPDWNGLGKVITFIEWLARVSTYPEQDIMFNTLYKRISYCCNNICEHLQRKARDGHNSMLFSLPDHEQTVQMQTITNVFNLGHMHDCKYIRQATPRGPRSLREKYMDEEEALEIRMKYIEWFSGELDERSMHQWWFHKHGHYLLNVAGVEEALRRVYDSKVRLRNLRRKIVEIQDTDGTMKPVPEVKPADIRTPPPTSKQVLDKLREVTDRYDETRDWLWDEPHKNPCDWPGDVVWKMLFGDLGFAVMLIAHGIDLQKLQQVMKHQWLVGDKELIRNLRAVWTERKATRIRSGTSRRKTQDAS